MSPKFLFGTRILPPSCKETRKARKSHRDQDVLLASELQAQSDLTPLDFDDKNHNDNDDDAAKNHPDSADPPDARKAPAACRTRAVKQDIKNWVRRVTRLSKRSSTRHSALTTPSCTLNHNGAGSGADDGPPSLLHLPGELQNLITSFLGPVPLALLRLTCRHFYIHIPTPAFINPTSSAFFMTPIHPSTPDPVRLIRCHRFAFMTALHPPPTAPPSPYLPRKWNIHATVCGAPFYPCTGCKAFHHLDWFAPYGARVQKFPSLANRPVDCRACVLHTVMPGEEEGLYSPEVWPGFAERVRGWTVGRWWRCECCGRCVREGEEVEMGKEERSEEEVGWAEMRARDVERWVGRGTDARTAAEVANRSPGRYLKVGLGVARMVVTGGERCVCGCDVCGMVGIDCWERGERRVVLYRM